MVTTPPTTSSPLRPERRGGWLTEGQGCFFANYAKELGPEIDDAVSEDIKGTAACSSGFSLVPGTGSDFSSLIPKRIPNYYKRTKIHFNVIYSNDHWAVIASTTDMGFQPG